MLGSPDLSDFIAFIAAYPKIHILSVYIKSYAINFGPGIGGIVHDSSTRLIGVCVEFKCELGISVMM